MKQRPDRGSIDARPRGSINARSRGSINALSRGAINALSRGGRLEARRRSLPIVVQCTCRSRCGSPCRSHGESRPRR
jgi:hypothetical protein